MRYFRVVAVPLSVLVFGVTVAAGQELASTAGEPTEHVRHLRSHKAQKPVLFTDEDKPEVTDKVKPEHAAPASKTATAEATTETAPRPKKVVAKPAAPKPVKQKTTASRNAARQTAAPAAAAPASGGFLEEIFGDN